VNTNNNSPIKLEIEVKLKLDGIDIIKDKLLNLGFCILVPFAYERNTIFDDAKKSLKEKRIVLRIRNSNGQKTLTLKLPPLDSENSEVYKVKQEVEADLKYAKKNEVFELFNKLDLKPFFKYEKFREIYQSPDKLSIVTIDVTPVGNYMEIESTPEEIDRWAAQLGFAQSDYITDSYYTLFLKAKKKGNHMLWAPGKRPKLFNPE